MISPWTTDLRHAWRALLRTPGFFVTSVGTLALAIGAVAGMFSVVNTVILKPLPFSSMIVASRNDDRVSFERAKLFASSWGSTLVDAGDCGHVGEAMKLGYWPFGLIHFGQLLASLR